MKAQLLLIIALASSAAFGQTYLPLKDFQDQSITSGGWQEQVVISTPGTHNWATQDLGSPGNFYANLSGWNGSGADNVNSWLISPVMNLATASSPTLTFMNAVNFSGPDIVVAVSNDYDGVSDPSVVGTWTDVTASANLSTGSFNWTNSGNVDLSAFNGDVTVYVAFVYTSLSTSGAAQWEIDDILVNEGGSGPSTPVSIYDIQYTTAPSGDSPELGNIVETGGIVTGVFNSGSNQGYFIQSGSGAWNGIYVNDNINVPTQGDSVIITGTVAEVFENTQVESISAYNNVSSGNTLPAAAAISTSDVNMEGYEGVLVSTTSATCIDPSLGFGEWSINDGSDTCVVDDLMYAYAPAAGNDYDVTGPVYFAFGSAKIEPRDAADVVGTPVSFTIYSIQYTTDPGGSSPYNGSNVTVNGTVVAESSNAFNSNDRGYWIQDGSGPWHGIFVSDTANTVSIGDSVEVSANVNENFSQTILRNVSSLNIIASGITIPAAAAISTADVNTEAYEGVLVEVTNATCINPSIGFGQWSVNDGSTDALVDDVMYEYLTPFAGTMYRVTGPVYYTYTEYKILPRDANDVEEILGVDELANDAFVVYPNPSNGTVHFDNTTAEEVKVYDALGQLVTTIRSNHVDLTQGMYLIKINHMTARVIVK